MTRQELYAWAAVASAIGIAGYYILAVIGLPNTVEPFGEELGGVLIRVILVAAGVELGLDVLQSISSLRIDKDERDRLVEGKSFRNAYFVLVAVAFAAIGNLALTELLGRYLGEGAVPLPMTALHILVLGVLLAFAVNATSRIYFYRRDA